MSHVKQPLQCEPRLLGVPLVTDGRPPSLDQSTPLLSVIVPVYNEECTVNVLLRRLIDSAYPDKEVIVVDDGSTDATPVLLEMWRNVPGVVLLRHPVNRGKGAAVQTGLVCAQGTITVIQDADLEYDPADLPRLVEIIRRGDADVVYGSRYLETKSPLPWTRFRLAVAIFNSVVGFLYGQWLTDEATCYKAFRTQLLRDLRLEATRFELCAELTAKVCRLRLPIVEVPISYHPRTADEGKKIGLRDAWYTLWTLVRWRLSRFHVRKPHR